MDTMLLRLFQTQVRDQCRFLLMAAQGVDAALKDAGSVPTDELVGRDEAMDRVWFCLQNLLTATANISKALWGAGGRLTKERRELRESLAVPDDSPLRPTDVRNHFEHFDERLDRWAGASAHRIYVDRNIGPLNMIVGDTIGPKDYFRHYDPSTGVASFWGDTFELRRLVEAAVDLLPRAVAEAAKLN